MDGGKYLERWRRAWNVVLLRLRGTSTLAGRGVESAEAKKGFWSRLASGLARTASSLGQGITDLVSKRKLDAATLDDLEDLLIQSDIGIPTAARITGGIDFTVVF